MAITPKPFPSQEAHPFDAFGITTTPPESVRLQTSVQTARPISPPPAISGLLGDLHAAPHLPGVPREPHEICRRPSATSLGSRVWEYVRRARSHGTTPETSPEMSPLSTTEAPPRRPHSKAECLTAFVFPLLKSPSMISSLYGPDAIAAFLQIENRTLQVQYHSGLAPLLLRQLETLRGIPAVPPATSTCGVNQAQAVVTEEYTCSFDSWMRAETKMAELANKRLKSDLEVAETWCDYLGQAVNDFIDEPNTFRQGWFPRHSCSWEIPHPTEAEHRSHDWLAWSQSENTPRAMLSWRMEASASDFDTLFAAAVNHVPPSWVLDLNYPGLEIDVHKGHITHPPGMTPEASLLALLAWHGMHHYAIRWAIVFNGNTAIVTYLAKQNTMFVTKPFGREGDDGLTLASAMFALATMNHESDANRPLYTMRNCSIGFHPRPAIAAVHDRWASLCSQNDWAACDFALYREHEVRAAKEEPELEQRQE